MFKIALLAVVFVIFCVAAVAQTLTNDAINGRIKSLGSSKTIELIYDKNSNVTKLMAVTENFSDSEAQKIGIQAMNFAIGFMYPGQELLRPPENVLLSFWVLTKKPRFGNAHGLTFNNGLDLGQARYIAKPRIEMEYLNFEISRADLEKVVHQPGTGFKLGDAEFSLTRGQQKAIADFLKVSDPVR